VVDISTVSIVIASETKRLKEFWKKQVSRERGQFENAFSAEENGEISISTASSEKNGKNQKY
jgi:hypothetical protein